MTEQATFGFSVRISNGEGSITTVDTLKDACGVLIDWPHARRGPFYQAARELVESAMKGETSAREAGEGFLALCQHAGVVVTD